VKKRFRGFILYEVKVAILRTQKTRAEDDSGLHSITSCRDGAQEVLRRSEEKKRGDD
jgi:hypothetical protein